MIRQRSEVFFIDNPAPFQDVYFPKQSGKELLPVVGINITLRNDFLRNPYSFLPLADANELPVVYITFRDRQDQILLGDAPAWMFGKSEQFLKPLVVGTPTAHGVPRFDRLPIDPQRCSVRTTRPFKLSLAIELLYAQT